MADGVAPKSARGIHAVKAIELRDISFRYSRDVPLFDGLSVRFASQSQRGHVSAIMGPSGCGKTTLLKLIAGIECPQSGSVHTEPPEPCVSYLPQTVVLFDHLSPMENARLFQTVSARRSRFDERRFSTLSETLGVAEILRTSKSVREISGGQRQRLSLLRALSVNPDFLLLDEPCIGLDAEVK